MIEDLFQRNRYMFFISIHRLSRMVLALLTIMFGIFLFSDSFAQSRSERKKKIDSLLRMIAIAEDSLSYQALTIVENYGEDLTRKSERKVIKLGANREWSRYVSPASERVLIIRDNLYFTKFLDKDSVSVRNRRSREGIFGDIALLKKNYYIRFLPEEKIQHRLVDVVKIRSKQKDRAWIKIWVDKKTGFVFRLERYTAEDKPLFVRYNENVVFDPEVDPGLFDVDYEGAYPSIPNSKIYDSPSEVQEELGISLVVPEVLPPGFSLSEISARASRHNPVVQFYYSDGLLSFSLFQEVTKRGDREMRVRKRRGRIIINEIKNNIGYTIISDIDRIVEGTLMKTFESIKLLKDTDETTDTLRKG